MCIDLITIIFIKSAPVFLPGQETEIPGFSLAFLFPSDTQKYYKYTGSLTSPPCNECVSWTILNNPIKISADQVRDYLFSCKNLQRLKNLLETMNIHYEIFLIRLEAKNKLQIFNY